MELMERIILPYTIMHNSLQTIPGRPNSERPTGTWVYFVATDKLYHLYFGSMIDDNTSKDSELVTTGKAIEYVS